MSLDVSNGILFGHIDGVISVYCFLRDEEETLAGGRFRSYTSTPQEHVVPINWSRASVTAALDWIEEFEAGSWSFKQTEMGPHFSFADYVTAIQFKLTLMDMAH